MDETLSWLLDENASPPWARYRARVDLLGQAEGEPEVQAAREAMLAHPAVQALRSRLREWPGPVLNSHKSAGHLLHMLPFLAYLGLRRSDPGVEPIVQQVLAHVSPQGPFQMRMNIPTQFGGSGQDELAWALCDAPTVVYALQLLGAGTDPRVQGAVTYLGGLVRDNGYPCAVSPEVGKFRGPGRKDDPCPYATLIMLKVLAQSPQGQSSPAARTATETLLSLWETSRRRHPYQFYMGADFRKLKAPLVWYDILHVLDTLSHFSWAVTDPRFQEMLGVVLEKAVPDRRYTAESIWKAWEGWDFGQKKLPSPWITFLVLRIQHRCSVCAK